MSTITYSSHTLDTAKFHPASLDALLRRGVAHFLGNEQSSKVVSKTASHVAKAKAEWEAANPGVTPDDEVSASFQPSPDVTAGWKHEFQLAAIAAILDGTVGVSTRGPAADPLDAMSAKVAKEQVIAVLKGNNIKPPKGDEAVKFPNGTSKTMDEMVATRLAHPNFKDGILAEARKRVAEAEKKAKRALAEQAKHKVEGAGAPDDLGL